MARHSGSLFAVLFLFVAGTVASEHVAISKERGIAPHHPVVYGRRLLHHPGRPVVVGISRVYVPRKSVTAVSAEDNDRDVVFVGGGEDADAAATPEKVAKDTSTGPRRIVVGGSVNPEAWIAQSYEPIAAKVGDTLVFNYPGGTHTVWEVPSGTCSFEDGKEIFATGPPGHKLSYVVSLNKPGTFFYASNVGEQCESGMLLQVTVS